MAYLSPLLLLSLVLISCPQKPWKPNFGQITNRAPDSYPDAVIKNFKTDFISLNLKKWELTADEAKFYTKEKRFNLSNLLLESYGENQVVVSRVRAGQGIIFNESKNIELSNQVMLRGSNQTVVYGSYFFWNNVSEKFTSPYRVTIVKGNGDLVSGTGFVGDRRLDQATLLSDVRGESPSPNLK